MIVLTGGAGFIGSCVLKKLNDEGIDDILVVDHLGTDEKWKNLVGKRFADFVHKDRFIVQLDEGWYDDMVDSVIHLGACSATTETDADYLMYNNTNFSIALASWCLHNERKMWYASSAATYGNGSRGYSDDDTDTPALEPLNMYGFSKHLFDVWVLRNGAQDALTGFKFFNVYGPNEYHKGSMRSVIHKAFPDARDSRRIRLFASCRPDYPDGGQKRDFIYVKDAVDMVWYFFSHPDIGGIFNIGTGNARTWNDLAHAMFAALDVDGEIEYIPMPDHLKGSYQYFTEADTAKLTRAGCPLPSRSLEDAIADYIRAHLLQKNPHL